VLRTMRSWPTGRRLTPRDWVAFGAQAQPLLRGDLGDDLLGLDLSGALRGQGPQRLAALDRHDVRDGVLLQPPRQPPVAAVERCRRSPSQTARRRPGRAPAWHDPAAAWSQTRHRRGLPPRRSVPGHRSSSWAGTTPGRSAPPHEARRRLGTPRPGSSRACRRCWCTGAGPRRTYRLSSESLLTPEERSPGWLTSAPVRAQR
jgi:hypothetical protein